jgi:hypothetical protein
MLAASLPEKAPLRPARRAFALLIAAAVALAPVGAAAAGLPAPDAKMPAQQTHALHHGHDAVPTAAKHCDDRSAPACCCDDAATCAQTCLQKCFGQMAVMPPDRAARTALLSRVAPRPAERPPGWSSAPQVPPPRA